MAVRRMHAELASGTRPQTGASAVANARVLALLAHHEASLMRVARQWSLCQDDALDAFQRGLEIYVRRLDTVDRATEAAWLKVVIRHEALAIRRARGDCVVPDMDFDATVPAAERSVEEQVLSGDRVSRSAEALRALKPDEARALMLKAHGLSYDEIGRRCGWTYTKVNRAITEGRRRFMEVYAALDAGSECERFAPALRALAEGTATSAQLVEVRPHLRRCTACRATVRDMHLSGLRRIRLVAPSLLTLQWLRERLDGGSGRPSRPPDPGAVVDAHLSPLHHVIPRIGHVVLPRAHGGTAERIGALHRAKQHAASVLQRVNSSDLAAAIHIATTTGGGRVATLGAVVGLCLSGVGAGTVCVVTGIVRAPFGLFEPHHQAIVVRHDHPSHKSRALRARAHHTHRAPVAPPAEPRHVYRPPADQTPTRADRTPPNRTASREPSHTPPAAVATASAPAPAAPLEFSPEPGATAHAGSSTSTTTVDRAPAPTKAAVTPDPALQEFGP